MTMEKKTDLPRISSLNMCEHMSQAQVAKELHISERQVRRIERSAIKKCAAFVLDHPENLMDMIFYRR